MDIWRVLEEAAGSYGDVVAVVDGDTRFTYRELRERAKALAAGLARMGIKRGDRVAIAEVNSHRYIEAYFGAARIGAVLASINYRLTPGEVAFVLEDSGARVLLANWRFASLVPGAWLRAGRLVWLAREGAHPTGDLGYEELLEASSTNAAPVEAAHDDVAHLYYTSGTTGRPKGVMLTHRNVCVHSRWAIDELGLTRADVWGHVAPMFHLADAWATFAVTMAGGRHAMLPKFEPGAALDLFERERVTASNLIPTMLNLMTRHPGAAARDLSSLRVILSGGAPIAVEVVRRIVETFRCDYVQTYGMTETSPYLTVSILPPELDAASFEERLRAKARTGRPFGGVELKVVDESGAPVARDDLQVGEIWVRGPTVTPGYWNRPQETAAAFRDGWLMTGDLAVIDGHGSVNIVDRKKDMIITGGENVYGTEVENVLYEHPAVLEAAVYGVLDEEWGEIVAAAVVLREGQAPTQGEITAFCRARLAGYKTPRIVRFTDALPRTGSGKISKRALRDAEARRRE